MKVLQKLSLALIAVLTFSCADEFIDTKPQANIPGEDQIVDIFTANDALIGLYSSLQSASIYGGDYIYLNGLFTDEFRHTGTFPSFAEVGSNDPAINNIDVQQIWTAHYGAIFDANRLIELVPNLTDASQQQIDRIVGQAQGVRALLYFNLVRMWGGVPLVTEALLDPAQIDNANAPRASMNEVFAQINSDLDAAISKLAGFTQSTYRFNQSAAKLVKAEVLMQQGQYPQAKGLLEDVLEAGFDFAPSYASLFGTPGSGTLASPVETIFAIPFNSVDGSGLAFFFNDSRGGRFELTPSNTLIGLFEEGDERANLIVDVGFPQMEKYTQAGDGADDTYVLRLPQAVLAYAEVLARENEFGEASFWLNLVRERAGLGDVTLDANNFVDVIATERFLELYGEGGADRYNTSKRLGILNNIIQNKTNAVFIPERQNLYPIPQQEIERNPNISSSDQNPGY